MEGKKIFCWAEENCLMKKLPGSKVGRIIIGLLLLFMPVLAHSQSDHASSTPPPIAQQMVREGDFAIKLESALGLGKSADEAGAETRLGELGITPRNGWIADYPVTPDIIGELQKAVGDAAEAGKIPLQKGEALKRFDTVVAEQSLAVKPHTMERTYEPLPEDAEQYPNPAGINDYYNDEGPPVVTYYSPPPDYYYLYAWIPYPFWWYDFWFPGYFILNDFHRSVYMGHRVAFISNHFNDVRANRVFRIDPVARFSGRTFAGIGVTNRRGFISTGVPRSERRIFNGTRTLGGPVSRAVGSSQRTSRGAVSSSYGSRPGASSFHGNRGVSSSRGSGGMGGGHTSHGAGSHGVGGRR